MVDRMVDDRKRMDMVGNKDLRFLLNESIVNRVGVHRYHTDIVRIIIQYYNSFTIDINI